MELLILAFVVVASICSVVGYKAGQRMTRKRLAGDLVQLEHRVASLNWHLQRDPQRALLDHGMTYVLNDMQSLLERTRREIDARREKEAKRVH